MFKVPLVAVPNQEIAFNADGAYWQLHIYQAISHMYADVSRDGVKLIDGVGCYGGIALLPYKHLYMPNFGNFIFDSDADWTMFGDSCELYYLTLEELTEYRALEQAALA